MSTKWGNIFTQLYINNMMTTRIPNNHVQKQVRVGEKEKGEKEKEDNTCFDDTC